MQKLRLVILISVAFVGPVAWAQTSTPDSILRKSKEAFKTAKNAMETESIALWCKDNIRVLNFKERDRLMVHAVHMMQENKLAEANELLRQVNELKDLTDNHSNNVCRPD